MYCTVVWVYAASMYCHVYIVEYVTMDVEDTAFDAKSVVDRNATTLFLTEMIRGTCALHALCIYHT